MFSPLPDLDTNLVPAMNEFNFGKFLFERFLVKITVSSSSKILEGFKPYPILKLNIFKVAKELGARNSSDMWLLSGGGRCFLPGVLQQDFSKIWVLWLEILM